MTIDFAFATFVRILHFFGHSSNESSTDGTPRGAIEISPSPLMTMIEDDILVIRFFWKLLNTIFEMIH
jgi:hypothetical protein